MPNKTLGLSPFALLFLASSACRRSKSPRKDHPCESGKQVALMRERLQRQQQDMAAVRCGWQQFRCVWCLTPCHHHTDIYIYIPIGLRGIRARTSLGDS